MSDFNKGNRNALCNESTNYNNEWRVRGSTIPEEERKNKKGDKHLGSADERSLRWGKNRFFAPIQLFLKFTQFILTFSD